MKRSIEHFVLNPLGVLTNAGLAILNDYESAFTTKSLVLELLGPRVDYDTLTLVKVLEECYAVLFDSYAGVHYRGEVSLPDLRHSGSELWDLLPHPDRSGAY